MSRFRSRRSPSLRQKLGLVLFGLALLVLGLGALEGVLAIFDIGGSDRFDDPFVGFEPGYPLFVERRAVDGAVRYVTSPEKLAFFNEQEFPSEKGADTYRIFALGGSTTAGRPYDATVAFPRWLERYLEAADPGRTWEVVNAGGISYASYRIVVLMKELVRYDPDLFIVYTGHNEFLEERTYGDILERPELVRRVQVWLGGLRSYALASRWVRGEDDEDRTESVLAAEVRATLDDWTGFDDYRRSEDFKQATLEHFTFNLRQMIALARSAGAEMLFVEPVSNLADFSPFKSEHRADLTLAERERFDRLLEAGLETLARGEQAEAIDLLRQLVAIDPDHAEAHYRLGRALLDAGERAEAEKELVRAKDLDVAPLRALSSFTEALRRVTAKEEVELVDLPGILAREGHDIPGGEVLLDHVHPDIPIHSLLAEELLARLERRGVVDPGEHWSRDLRQSIESRVLAGLDAVYYARRDLNLAKVLGWSGKLEEAEAPLRRAAAVLVDDPEVFLHLGTLYARTGRLAAARSAAERAVELAPGLPAAHFNLGVVLGHLGAIEQGIEALERCLELRPDYPEATYNLALLLRRAGRFDEALAALARADRMRPGALEVHVQLARTLRQAGRAPEALAAIDRALLLSPGDAEALTERGIVLAELLRLEEAKDSLEAALATNPSIAEAHYGLGVVATRDGQTERARAAYERAVDLAPQHVLALNNLGILYGRAGELERARSLLERAVAADPAYAEAQFNLAVVLDSAGLPQQSLARLERAVALEPTNGRFRYALGALLAHLGRSEEARPHLEQAAGQGIEGAAEVLRRSGVGPPS